MNVTPYLELKAAPQWIFDALPERRTRPRFMVPTADGDWRTVTWGGFADQIRRLSCYLASVGLAPGERGAIYAPNRVEWLSAAYAIQAAGGVMVPVYPACTADQLAYVVSHSDAKVLFVDTQPLLDHVIRVFGRLEGLARVIVLSGDLDPVASLQRLRETAGEGGGEALPTVADVSEKFVAWEATMAVGRAQDEEDPLAFDRRLWAIDLERPGLMLYTSGTTGNPKGVPLTHRNVGINGLDWLRCNGPLLEADAVDLLWLPMSHIFGFGAASIGNTLGFMTYLSDPKTVLTQLPLVRPHVFMSVPAYWEKLAQPAFAEGDAQARRDRLHEVTGGRLRFCLSGGAGLKQEVKELYYGAGLLIIEGYGLTECSPTLTLNRPDAFRFDTVGKPLPSVELRLADDGEILARGENVFAGYHKNPDATAECFTDDGWFKTGDVGRFTEDGFLQIVDRKKEILVTAGGKNVAPGNIERGFADDPIFEHVVVYGDGKKFITAGVWLNPEAIDERVDELEGDARKAEIDALVRAGIDRVNGRLARFEQIKKYRIIDTPLTIARGLLTSTLKVRRKKVYETFRSELESLYEK
ncbi:MAG: long-chain fatty acid--CoA ligase [Myxococcota bacterium]